MASGVGPDHGAGGTRRGHRGHVLSLSLPEKHCHFQRSTEEEEEEEEEYKRIQRKAKQQQRG